MTIKTQEDWWNTAKKTLPRMPDYASEVSLYAWDQVAAQKAYGNRDYKALHRLLFEFWWRLPDTASIRKGPFFDMCDLLSENWVFEKENKLGNLWNTEDLIS